MMFTICWSQVGLTFVSRSTDQTNSVIKALLFNGDCYASVIFIQPGWSLNNHLINVKRKEDRLIVGTTLIEYRSG